MAELDRDQALEIQRRAFRDFVAFAGGSAPGSTLIELPGGVAGAVVPATPERSIVNSVTYRDSEPLLAGLEEIAAAYGAAGVRAWTVWAPEDDREAITGLERAGHAFDGDPAAMVLDLGEVGGDGLRGDGPGGDGLGDLDWDPDADLAELGRLNDDAYGAPAGSGIAAAFRAPPEGLDLRIYRARAGGETASVLATIDHAPAPGAAGPDCGVYFVATPERFRRRGLATRLMLAALAEARERGCATSSLQASSLGMPIYRALGYRPWFRFRMYERRA